MNLDHPAADTPASTIPTHLLHQLLDALVRADLTNAGYRVYLSLIQRLMVQGRDSEAVGLEQVARQLGLSRNTTSNAMAALSEAGLIQRKAVRRRGAPTRTQVIGLGRIMLRHVADQPTLWRGHQKASTLQHHLDTLHQPDPPESSPIEQPLAATPAPPTGIPSPDSPTPVEEGAHLSQAETDHAAPVVADRPAFRFDPDISASMSAKIGTDAMYDLLQGTVRPIDPAWALTEDEQAHYHQMGRRPAAPSKAPTPAATVRKQTLPTPSPHVVEEVNKILPWLDLQLGTALAHKVANQIAYQVHANKLGRGNATMGVRAALSLIRTHRWQRPHDMPAAWEQAWSRVHHQMGNAKKNVH